MPKGKRPSQRPHFHDHFSEKASLYASARPRYPQALFDFVAAHAPTHRRAWDCGTGNGQAAVSLARHFQEVLASDPSAEQIAHAHAAERVIYSVQHAEQTDFPDGCFDAICVATALHWFDVDAFLREVQRVAAPGAIFAAWGYHAFTVAPDFDACFKRCIGDVIAPHWAPQVKLLWNEYREVKLPFPQVPAPPMQIVAEWNLKQMLAYLHTWSALRKCVKEIGAGFLEAGEDALAQAWGPPTRVRQVTMPLHLIAGRVQARGGEGGAVG